MCRLLLLLSGCDRLLCKEGERILSFVPELICMGTGNELMYSLCGYSTHGHGFISLSHSSLGLINEVSAYNAKD